MHNSYRYKLPGFILTLSVWMNGMRQYAKDCEDRNASDLLPLHHDQQLLFDLLCMQEKNERPTSLPLIFINTSIKR